MSSDEKSNSMPWQDLGSNERAKHLLDTGLMADCSFIVGKGPNAKRFDCHKIILIASSPVFEKMFCGSFKEANTTSPIPIPNVKPDIFRLFLEFIYDPCQNANQWDYELKLAHYEFEKLRDLLYLGNMYMIKSLKDICCRALQRKLKKSDEEVILNTFALAVTTGHDELAEQCVRYFESGITLLKSEHVFNLDASIFCEFLKHLEGTKSTDVLKTIESYIERNSLIDDADDFCDYENQSIGEGLSPEAQKSVSKCLAEKSNNCEKANEPESSASMNFSANGSQCHNNNNANMSCNSNHKKTADQEHDRKIIKQIYESVNFKDMNAFDFVKAAREKGLSTYVDYERKYKILEELVLLNGMNNNQETRRVRWS